MVIKEMTFAAALFVGAAILTGNALAQEFNTKEGCRQVIKDTDEAIDINPAVAGKEEEMLLAVMALARVRCEEGQFENAKDLLELARGVVASEESGEVDKDDDKEKK